MILTGEQLANRIVEYLRTNVLPGVPDITTKIMLGTIANASVIRKYVLGNKIMSFFQTEDGNYDLDTLVSSLRSSVNEFGALKITIPEIPLLSAAENSLSFTADDIDKLITCLNRGD